MLPSDAELVERCRRGDADAWRMLVERYQRLVYGIPRKAGLDAQACEDVFQHVFAALVEHLDRIAQPERLGVWLVTTAKREAWRLAKQNRRTQPLASDDDSDDYTTGAERPLLDENPLPDEITEQLLEQHEIRVALTRLDERCRALLNALYYRDEPPSYTELAQSIGIPEGSIGPTRARCLKNCGGFTKLHPKNEKGLYFFKP